VSLTFRSRRSVIGFAGLLASTVVALSGLTFPAASGAVQLAYVSDPASGEPGTVLSVKGTGCAPSGNGFGGTDGAFAFVVNPTGNFSQQPQTLFHSLADGSFAGTFVVPSNATVGRTYETAVSCYGTGDMRGWFADPGYQTFTVTAPLTTPGGFRSLSPHRLLDTRAGVGAPKAAVAAGGTVRLKVTGRGGVPVSGVTAVVLNVTVTQAASQGFITVYAGGTTRPSASNLNFLAGQTVPNLVIAPVATDGTVSLFNGSANTVQLIADVSGYFRSGTPTAAGTFKSLTPVRLLDTRTGVGAPKAAVAAGGTVRLKVTGRGGVPVSGVTAVVLNVTVTQPASQGFITVYAGGTTRPSASNLNFLAGQTVPNLVIAPVATDGTVSLFNGSAGTVQLIADVSGYTKP